MNDTEKLNEQLESIYRSQESVLKKILRNLTKIINFERIKNQQPLQIQIKIERKISKLAAKTAVRQKQSDNIKLRIDRIKTLIKKCEK